MHHSRYIRTDGGQREKSSETEDDYVYTASATRKQRARAGGGTHVTPLQQRGRGEHHAVL